MMRRLGFSNEASKNLFTNQGIDCLEKFSFLIGKGISNMMKTIRHCGHQITDVGPRHLISNLAKENVKLLAYLLRHSTIFYRTFTMAEITRKRVRSISEIRNEENNPTDPTTKSEIITGNYSSSYERLQCI